MHPIQTVTARGEQQAVRMEIIKCAGYLGGCVIRLVVKVLKML